MEPKLGASHPPRSWHFNSADCRPVHTPILLAGSELFKHFASRGGSFFTINSTHRSHGRLRWIWQPPPAFRYSTHSPSPFIVALHVFVWCWVSPLWARSSMFPNIATKSKIIYIVISRTPSWISFGIPKSSMYGIAMYFPPTYHGYPWMAWLLVHPLGPGALSDTRDFILGAQDFSATLRRKRAATRGSRRSSPGQFASPLCCWWTDAARATDIPDIQWISRIYDQKVWGFPARWSSKTSCKWGTVSGCGEISIDFNIEQFYTILDSSRQCPACLATSCNIFIFMLKCVATSPHGWMLGLNSPWSRSQRLFIGTAMPLCNARSFAGWIVGALCTWNRNFKSRCGL